MELATAAQPVSPTPRQAPTLVAVVCVSNGAPCGTFPLECLTTLDVVLCLLFLFSILLGVRGVQKRKLYQPSFRIHNYLCSVLGAGRDVISPALQPVVSSGRQAAGRTFVRHSLLTVPVPLGEKRMSHGHPACLLYTSDAADEHRDV